MSSIHYAAYRLIVQCITLLTWRLHGELLSLLGLRRWHTWLVWVLPLRGVPLESPCRGRGVALLVATCCRQHAKKVHVLKANSKQLYEEHIEQKRHYGIADIPEFNINSWIQLQDISGYDTSYFAVFSIKCCILFASSIHYIPDMQKHLAIYMRSATTWCNICKVYQHFLEKICAVDWEMVMAAFLHQANKIMPIPILSNAHKKSTV